MGRHYASIILDHEWGPLLAVDQHDHSHEPLSELPCLPGKEWSS